MRFHLVWAPLQALAGDKWSLGFVHETEEQVVRHLEGHLDNLSLRR